MLSICLLCIQNVVAIIPSKRCTQLTLTFHHASLFLTASLSLPKNVNGSPSKTTATAVGIGVGVSVGVVILVASVLVVVVIASRNSKYTNMFHHLFNVPPLVAFLYNTRIIQVRIFCDIC